eukprot:TRINITY_DN4763_c0_g1_i2.p1 TRINITY_DN4763_c0_g1~~TRINITY_DN4763_c0_g1_i2.p1  ORF type:complete len:1139 (+),score=324.80 TRINITY_DN4763_c0_g1_i2:493-3417(+)
MKEGFTELERGNIRGALDHVLRAEEILDKNASQRTQELKVCRAYRDALQWLRAMERMNNWNGVSSTSTKKGDDLVKEIWKRQAICARAAAEFTLQPRHRMTAVRMCIQSNLRARNFSIAASFIRLLLPLHTIDEKRLESQLQICQEHMYKDEGLLSYTCPNCKHQVSHAPAVCSVCQAPMDWSYFKSEFIDNLVEVISPPTDLRESGELTETQLVDKMAASTLLASGKSKRDVIAQEIFDSEKKYVESLDLLVQMYMKPMQELPAVKSPQFSAAVKTIFGDIQIIHGFNSLFLSRLEERMNDWNPTQQLGPIFLELVDYMKVYTNYVNNYTLSIVTVTELKKQSQEVANFLENTKKKCQYKDIQSLLIQPIQRLPRYVLLLQELKEATPSNHPDHDPLELAFVKMKVVADYVNEKKREAEDMNSVLIIQDQITYPFSEPEPLIQPHRRFIKQEGVIQLSKKNEHKVRTLFLFNDLLLLVRKVKGDGALGSSGSSTRGPMDRAVSKSAMTRSRRNSTADINQLGQAIYQFKHQFPLGSCVIQEEEEGKVLLRVSRDKVYTFSATSRETWEKFISDLKEAISVIRSAQNSRAAQLKETNSEKVSHDVVSPHDWRLLFATATEMEYPKGTIILTKGSQNFKVFRILRGSIACIINPRCHYDMGEGDLMGGGCIIGENRVEGDMVVQSEGGARVAVIAVRVVRRLLNVEANLAMKVFSTVARDFAIRLRTLEGSHSHPHRAPSTKAMDNISDIEFHHFFPTLKGETLLKTYSGTYKRNVAHQGLIFITHNYLCFHSQIFGFSKKSAVNLGSISNQEASKQTTIDVRCKAPEKREEKTIKYTFNTMQDRDDALNTLTIVKKNHFERGRTDVVEYPSPAITTKASGNSKNPGQFKKLFGKDKPLLGKFMFDSQMEGLPTKDDWVIILKEAKTVTFKKRSSHLHRRRSNPSHLSSCQRISTNRQTCQSRRVIQDTRIRQSR